jgi:hypothetical protein
LRLGNAVNAEYYFNNTLEHLKPPFMVFTERIVGGIPHFITGNERRGERGDGREEGNERRKK